MSRLTETAIQRLEWIANYPGLGDVVVSTDALRTLLQERASAMALASTLGARSRDMEPGRAAHMAVMRRAQFYVLLCPQDPDVELEVGKEVRLEMQVLSGGHDMDRGELVDLLRGAVAVLEAGE